MTSQADHLDLSLDCLRYTKALLDEFRWGQEQTVQLLQRTSRAIKASHALIHRSDGVLAAMTPIRAHDFVPRRGSCL